MLACPQCHQPDNLQTIETMEAQISCERITPDGPEYSPKEEIVYDSTSIDGVVCTCGWRYLGPDWITHLATK